MSNDKEKSKVTSMKSFNRKGTQTGRFSHSSSDTVNHFQMLSSNSPQEDRDNYQYDLVLEIMQVLQKYETSTPDAIAAMLNVLAQPAMENEQTALAVFGTLEATIEMLKTDILAFHAKTTN